MTKAISDLLTQAMEEAASAWHKKTEEEKGAEWAKLLKSANKGDVLTLHDVSCQYMGGGPCSCTATRVVWPGSKALARA